jgi:hypothetical protein
MNKGRQWLLATGMALTLIAATHAEDNVADLVNGAAETVPALDLDEADLQDSWRDWVNTQPWSQGNYAGGVQDFPAKGIVVSSGISFVRTRNGQPGWIDSRMMAYAQADLEARGRLVEFWMQKMTNARKLDVIDNTNFNDGVIQDMRDMSAIRTTLDRWGEKAVRLTDALLDKLISLADEDYDPDELNTLPPERQKVVLEEMYRQSIKRVAAQTLTGVTTVFTAETPNGNETQVLVGVLWSPKLEGVSWSIRNDGDTPPRTKPGTNITQWVSGLGPKLLGMWGSRVMVDEKGDYNVVAFAQAEPPRTSPTRQASALHRAKDAAENRARGMVADFITEKLVFTNTQQTAQVFQELEDTYAATEITRRVRKVIEGRRKTLRLSGLRTVKRWSMTHPVSGQKVAGAVVGWSPSSRDMAKRMARTMSRPPKKTEEPRQTAGKPDERRSLIKSIDIDTSAY